jgi:hypothetical protein
MWYGRGWNIQAPELHFLDRIILTVSDKLSLPTGPHYVNSSKKKGPEFAHRVYLLFSFVRFSERTAIIR